ncbi:MAG: glycosyltransferase family 4 protein [Acidobacteria bacterium]|nr:glycosyltransferase family 4 protein [Acidobacteriota bacterium]
MGEWHIITSEYPPQAGGVSDYTRVVAEGLADAGDCVHVWCPALRAHESDAREFEAEAGACRTSAGEREATGERVVVVHRDFGGFAPSDLRRVGARLNERRAPRRLLVQYVPHGYGYRAMNLAFCLWLWRRARVEGDEVQLMVHEPFLDFAGAWRQRAAATVQRVMTTVLLNAASRVLVATPAWGELWRPFAFGSRVEFEWLPVPCSIPVISDAAESARVRARYGVAQPGHALVGHLGTYTRHIAQQLELVLPALLARHETASALLLGRGSVEACDRMLSAHTSLAGRIHAAGALPARELSTHLAACDLLVQPFTDGVSTRRTSVMAGLRHGLSIVTTRGRLTEPLWTESGAVELVAADDAEAMVRAVEELMTDDDARQRLAARGRALYRERFDAAAIIAALREGKRHHVRLAA